MACHRKIFWNLKKMYPGYLLEISWKLVRLDVYTPCYGLDVLPNQPKHWRKHKPLTPTSGLALSFLSPLPNSRVETLVTVTDVITVLCKPSNSDAKQNETFETHTHPFNSHLSGTNQVSQYQKSKNQSGFYWSKRQWVAVASAGPYANLHITQDR